MFGTATYPHMPATFLTDPSVWDAYIGEVWHAVLRSLALPPHATVIEVAPGSSAKIGHALAHLGFCGDLHIVEAAPNALEALLPKYRTLLPRARLHTHPQSLSAAYNGLPRQPDVIVASHVLDDMLLACARTPATFEWANRYSDHINSATTQAWQVISVNVQTLDDAIKSTVAEALQAIVTLAPRHVVMSQYPSATLRDNNLEALNQAALQVFDGVARAVQESFAIQDCTPQLMQLPHYNNQHIGLHVLNPRYWLSCTRRI